MANNATFMMPRTLRLSDGAGLVDALTGLVLGAVLGTLTGYLWAIFNPIQLAPYIHLRIFAFLIPVFGLVFGRASGFVAGYVASVVWGLVAGSFVLLHTPLADRIAVGLTGWAPAAVLAGSKSRRQLLAEMSGARFWEFYARSMLVCLLTGLVMALIVALSLRVTVHIPFRVGFGLIGIVSDTAPMVVGTAPATYVLLKLAKNLTWIRRW